MAPWAAAAIALFVALPAPASAAGGWGEVKVVSTVSEARPPAWLASNERGDIFVVWEVENGLWQEENSIFAARRGTDGTWHAPAEIATKVYAGGWNIAAAVDPAGNCMVVVGARDSSGYMTLVATRYDASLDSWSTAEELPGLSIIDDRGSRVTTGPSTSPALAVDEGGNFTAAWQSGRYGLEPTAHISSARYEVGRGWQATSVISNLTRSNQYGPQLGADADGRVIAIWGQNLGPSRVSWNRYVPGAGWGTPQRLEDLDGFAGPPALAVSADGSAIAAWEFENGSVPLSVFASNYTAGGVWSPPVQIGPHNASFDSTPAAVADPEGAAVVAWTQTEPGGQTIWAAGFEPAKGWGNATRAGTDVAHHQTEPRLAGHSRGGATLVWWEDIPGNATGSESAYANRYDPDTGWGTPVLIDSSPNATGRTPDVCGDRGQWAIVTWLEPNSNGWAVLVRQFGPPPEKPPFVLVSGAVVTGISAAAIGAVAAAPALLLLRKWRGKGPKGHPSHGSKEGLGHQRP